MDYKSLIEKYFAGETTLEEEARLKAYFRDEQAVEESLKTYTPLFQFFEKEGAAVLPDGFEEAVLSKVSHKTARRFRLRPLQVVAAAAAVAVLLTAAMLFYCEINPEPEPPVAAIDWSKYEPKTTEEAYAVTRSALMRVSGELNRGTKMAIEGLEKVKD